jgi:hypothetical protein
MQRRCMRDPKRADLADEHDNGSEHGPLEEEDISEPFQTKPPPICSIARE